MAGSGGPNQTVANGGSWPFAAGSVGHRNAAHEKGARRRLREAIPAPPAPACNINCC